MALVLIIFIVFIGGLTSNDFIIAVKINDLTLEGIIRKKAT